MRRFRSLFLFFVVPGASAVAPLLLYPAVTSRFGQSGFASMAIGQSIGVATAVICELGWSVVGPQAVARQRRDERPELHVSAIATRITALGIGLPLAAWFALAVGGDFPLESGLIAASFACNALSANWFLTGTNQPGLILASDTAPRIFFNLLGALSIAAGGPLWLVALANWLALASSLVLVSVFADIPIVPNLRAFRGGWALIRSHAALTGGRAISVMYTSLVTGLLGAVAPSAVPGYAATDRMMRMGLTILTGLPNRLQSWVGTASEQDRMSRSNKAILANSVLGIAAGLACWLILPTAATLLFSGTIEVMPSWAAIAGATVLVICASRGLGLSLVAENGASWIAAASVAAATAGLISLFTLAPRFGVVGGLLSALIAESTGLVAQAVFLLRLRR